MTQPPVTTDAKSPLINDQMYCCRGCGRFYAPAAMDSLDGRWLVPPCVWTTCRGARVTCYWSEETLRPLQHQAYVAALLQLALERAGFHLPPALRIFQERTAPESPEVVALHDAVEEAKDGILSLLCNGSGKTTTQAR